MEQLKIGLSSTFVDSLVILLRFPGLVPFEIVVLTAVALNIGGARIWSKKNEHF
jgi:hypothetical protein